MKKIFCAVLALAAMASCSNEDTIEYNKQAIAFGDAFVNNSTRADYSSNDKKVTEFKVWGTVADDVYIFNGDRVYSTKNGSTVDYGAIWYCDNVQYWVPNASYAFTAVVDGVLNDDHATIPFTVADGVGNLDLLYATATAEVDNNGTVTAGDDSDSEIAGGLVKFNFSHLLSKLQFTVTNGLSTDDYSIKVTGITVTGVAKDGIYTVDTGAWAKDGSNTTTLTFGTTDVIASDANAVASDTRQILPVAQTLGVTIAYDIYFNSGVDAGGNPIITKISEATKSGTINEMTYAKSTVYNITAEITANQINFTVGTVKGWTDGGDIDVE